MIPMDFLERFIPLLAALLTAIAPVLVAVIGSGMKSRSQQKRSHEEQRKSFSALQETMQSMDKRLATVETHAEADYKNILQIQIMSEEMPLEVRLEAGEKYVARGWNGAIKAKYELLKEEYKRREKEGT